MSTQTCPYCFTPLAHSAQKCPACGTSLVPNGHTLPIRSTLQNRYVITKVLGEGGFGITYLAYDNNLKRNVAIKELFPEHCHRQGNQVVYNKNLDITQLKDSFIQEAQTIAQFSHAGIVRVWDTFQENNTAYMLMEYLEGQTLEQLLHQKQRLTTTEVLHFNAILLDALEVIHQAGMIHRDIKPANIFLHQDGRVILIDFGSARLFDTDKTSTHTRMVTPGYAPPRTIRQPSQSRGIYRHLRLGCHLVPCLIWCYATYSQ